MLFLLLPVVLGVVSVVVEQEVVRFGQTVVVVEIVVEPVVLVESVSIILRSFSRKDAQKHALMKNRSNMMNDFMFND